MQKVIHVNYSGKVPYDESLKTLNSYLAQGWKVVLTQPVRQEIAFGHNSCGWGTGEYGVTFVIQKD